MPVTHATKWVQNRGTCVKQVVRRARGKSWQEIEANVAANASASRMASSIRPCSAHASTTQRHQNTGQGIRSVCTSELVQTESPKR